MEKVEYIIVGDTDKYEGCLVCLAGDTREGAEELLNNMLTNPSDNAKVLMEGHTNLRVKQVKSRDCWWNYGTD
jgi:hypothetical protein